jgi:chitinase
MKNALFSILLSAVVFPAWGQYRVGPARNWDRFPPQAQEPGFGVYASRLVQMDADPALEEVFLFSRDKGHYPYFDVFCVYYVIVDYYTKEIEYKSGAVLTSKRELMLEDRNQDGVYELYRSYFRDEEFSVDKEGNYLQTVWAYDCIELKRL